MTTAQRTRSISPWLLLSMIIVPTCGQQLTPPASSNTEPIVTSLCDVVAHPEKFANKLVKFGASFVSDGLERSILVHAGCKVGIVPYPSADGRKRPDVEAFDKAIEAGAPGTADKVVVATFTGRFVWKPPSKRILEIEGVSELRVSPLQGSEKSKK